MAAKDFGRIKLGVGAVFAGLPAAADAETEKAAEVETKRKPGVVPAEGRAATPKKVHKTPTEKKIRKQQPSKNVEVPDPNPYSTLSRVKWPLLVKMTPFIVPTSDEVADITVGINFRASRALEITVNEHCRMIGANRSEWLREAVTRLLAMEQGIIGDKNEEKDIRASAR